MISMAFSFFLYVYVLLHVHISTAADYYILSDIVKSKDGA